MNQAMIYYVRQYRFIILEYEPVIRWLSAVWGNPLPPPPPITSKEDSSQPGGYPEGLHGVLYIRMPICPFFCFVLFCFIRMSVKGINIIRVITPFVLYCLVENKGVNIRRETRQDSLSRIEIPLLAK